jgi:transketolase
MKWWKRGRSRSVQLQHRPACTLVLTRQAMPTFDRTKYASASGAAKGAYVLADAPGGKPDVILMGTGSEVSLCVVPTKNCKTEGINARVVSMPSWEIFAEQDAAYKESVLPAGGDGASFRGDGLHLRLGAYVGRRDESWACTVSEPPLP